jgi:hypothetical protein
LHPGEVILGQERGHWYIDQKPDRRWYIRLYDSEKVEGISLRRVGALFNLADREELLATMDMQWWGRPLTPGRWGDGWTGADRGGIPFGWKVVYSPFR